MVANNDVLRRTFGSSFHRSSPEVHSPLRKVTEGRNSGVLLLLCLLTQYLRWQGPPYSKDHLAGGGSVRKTCAEARLNRSPADVEAHSTRTVAPTNADIDFAGPALTTCFCESRMCSYNAAQCAASFAFSVKLSTFSLTPMWKGKLTRCVMTVDFETKRENATVAPLEVSLCPLQKTYRGN